MLYLSSAPLNAILLCLQGTVYRNHYNIWNNDVDLCLSKHSDVPKLQNVTPSPASSFVVNISLYIYIYLFIILFIYLFT